MSTLCVIIAALGFAGFVFSNWMHANALDRELRELRRAVGLEGGQ